MRVERAICEEADRADKEKLHWSFSRQAGSNAPTMNYLASATSGRAGHPYNRTLDATDTDKIVIPRQAEGPGEHFPHLCDMTSQYYVSLAGRL